MARGPGAGPRGMWRGLPASAGRAAPAQDGPSPEARRRAGRSPRPEEADGAVAEGRLIRSRDFACSAPPRIVWWCARQAAAGLRTTS